MGEIDEKVALLYSTVDDAIRRVREAQAVVSEVFAGAKRKN
ncbi:MAG: hypothetical protein ACE5JO_06460 [Candidatus Binatia bacterium]